MDPMIGRSLSRALLFCGALALAWIGYLAVGSWEATEDSTRTGVVLIVGGAITIALIGASFMRNLATPLLWAALAVSVTAWVVAILIE